MKRVTLFFAIVLGCFLSKAQQNSVNLSMQSGYADRVFYDFSEANSESYAKNAWDIAFLGNSARNIGVRVNAGKGIEVYEASADTTDYDNLNPAHIGNWTQLYNSDSTWALGAFDHGSASFGWGEYNTATHIVEGTVLFVLKYEDGTFRKLWIKEFQAGYTFEYATWDDATSSWVDNNSYTLANSSNPDRIFNYFNLASDSEVTAEPKADEWDLIFHQYSTELPQGGQYTVTGVFNHPKFEVAQNTQAQVSDYPTNPNYSKNISTIGYDWKSFSGSSFTVEPDRYYYLKNENNGEVFQLHFTGFEGSSTGKLSFNYENITANLSTLELEKGALVSLYPNPTVNKQVSILVENKEILKEATFAVYDLNGRKMLERNLNANAGFSHRKINLSRLASGTYIVKISGNGKQCNQKLIVD